MYLQRLIMSLMLLLTGCSGGHSYTEPRTGSGPLATVQGSFVREGAFYWNKSEIAQIDNQTVNQWVSTGSKINVLPGKHQFVIHSSFLKGFGSGPYESIADINLKVKANKNYRFIGNSDGAKYQVWAVDETGKRVSSVSRAPYYPRSSEAIVPVIITN